jgi:hypothetical protein
MARCDHTEACSCVDSTAGERTEGRGVSLKSLCRWDRQINKYILKQETDEQQIKQTDNKW